MATEATEAAGHGGEHAVGMPQLDFSTWPNQIFWLLVTLVVIYLRADAHRPAPHRRRFWPNARARSPTTLRQPKS